MYDIDTIKTNNGSFAIFSVPADKLVKLVSFMSDNGIGFKPLIGYYKNKFEISYCVAVEHMQKIIKEGFLKGEESYLKLGSMNGKGSRKAWLVFLDLDRSTFFAGFYKNCSKGTALASPGYSLDPSTNSYYTTHTAP